MWPLAQKESGSRLRSLGVAVVAMSAALLAQARTSAAANCDWKVNDPAALIRSCTAQLKTEKAPAAWMYFNRGLAFKLIGKFNAARRDYSKAIELDPTFAPAYANRGNVLILLNDIEGALADYRKALALDPGDTVTRANLEAIEAALKKMNPGSGVGVSSGGSPSSRR